MNEGPLLQSTKLSAVQRRFSPADLVWKTVGVAALAISVWMLSRELRHLSLQEIGSKLFALSPMIWFAAGAAALAAYLLLGAYERLALHYLGKRIDPIFVHVCAAATYAFAHMVGASVFSGAVLRYRAYSSKGLVASEIAKLVAFCTLTFCLGIVTVLGVVLLLQPTIVDRFIDTFPIDFTNYTGKLAVGGVFVYVLIALIPVGAIRLRSSTISYPKFGVALLQVLVSSMELLAAALIMYVALPAASNPRFIIVTGVFVLSFAAALLSHAPGGLGVFELAFLTGLTEVPEIDVLAALVVFRLYYFVLPFIFSVVVMTVFETRYRRTV
jgi:uncharacterized membrane protein YbhN (UPF0104 family)